MNNEKPSWLVVLDKQIQRARGSKKRQLLSLREGQLRKHSSSPAADVSSRLKAIAGELVDLGEKFPGSLFAKQMNKHAFEISGARFMLDEVKS